MPRGIQLPITDEARLWWCIHRSAQLFRRNDPEPRMMLAFFPQQQDGFARAEARGGSVPAYTHEAKLSDHGGDAMATVRHLIDSAMLRSVAMDITLVASRPAAGPIQEADRE